jgi:hypothetical protein
MPLDDGYGVVIGTIADHYIEPPDEEGRWPHYKIFVDTPAGEYECVINLKSRSEIKVEYRDFRNLGRSFFQDILDLSDGYHALSSNSSSGALDVIRHPGLMDPFCLHWYSCWFPFRKINYPELYYPKWSKLLIRKRCHCTQWWMESGTNLIELIEYYLMRVHRIYVFGEPYNSGLGMHNVHMNQGDPIDSPFSAENGIWQDGGLILEYTDPQPRLSVFVTKFQTQSLRTDEDGRPIP